MHFIKTLSVRVNQSEHYMHCNALDFWRNVQKSHLKTWRCKQMKTNIQSNNFKRIKSYWVKTFLTGRKQHMCNASIWSADRGNWWTRNIKLWMFGMNVNSGKPPMSFIKIPPERETCLIKALIKWLLQYES